MTSNPSPTTQKAASLLSDEELTIAVATALGWTELMPSRFMPGQVYGFQPGKGPPTYIKSRVPDYCHDLNTMHEVEKTIPEVKGLLYWKYLVDLCCAFPGTPVERATARQRAEAFYLTMTSVQDGTENV